MIRIVINGIAGRMGKEIVSVLKGSEKFQLVGGIDVPPFESPVNYQISGDPGDLLPKAEVVVDFSLPEGSLKILQSCREHKRPLVTGTTGFSEAQLEEFRQAARLIPIVQAFNFSIGVNLLIELVKRAAFVLEKKADIEIVETHHRNKKDSPSGTAMMLARAITDSLNRPFRESLKIGRNGVVTKRGEEIGIHSLRGGAVIGEHQILFFGENENLSLTHQALNRKIFVDGALTAAEWVLKQPAGIYGMKEVLGL